MSYLFDSSAIINLVKKRSALLLAYGAKSVPLRSMLL